jgi:hypothetical protein
MPTNTYVALATQTLTSTATNVDFTGISSAYTDLKMVITGTVSAASSIYIQFNGDTATNYSYTDLTGDGSSTGSSRSANRSNTAISVWYSSASISQIEFDVMNYSNTTTFKTVLSKATTPSTFVRRYVALWRKTPEAINRINIINDGVNFNIGCTFTLYGIKTANAGLAKATGGTITFGGDGYIYHTFTSSGTFTPLQSLTCEYLVLAGGGGGGNRYAGGGGGAGGYRELTQTFAATGQTVTVGAGGAGATGIGATAGTKGSNSVLGSSTSTGGGGGASNSGVPGALATTGGSGGGGDQGGGNTAGAAGNEGSYSPVEGFAGGNGAGTGGSFGAGGGGGGASAVGVNGSSNSSSFATGGTGGAGVTSSISGTSVTRGGGGGGGVFGARG